MTTRPKIIVVLEIVRLRDGSLAAERKPIRNSANSFYGVGALTPMKQVRSMKLPQLALASPS